MFEKYPILARTGIAFLLAITAIFIPVVAIRIAFAGIAGIIFALMLKKYSALVITILVISMIIIGVGNVAVNFYNSFGSSFGFLFNPLSFLRIGNGNYFNPNDGNDYNEKYGGYSFLEPDSETAAKKDLKIYADAVEINFTDSVKDLRFPSLVKTGDNGDSLTLDARNIDNKIVRITISKDFFFDQISIQSNYLMIKGEASGKNLKIYSDFSELDSVLHFSDSVDIRGNMLNVARKMDTKYFRINGNVINLKIDSLNMSEVDMTGNFVHGSIKYLDSWTDKRSVRLHSDFGELELLTPHDNPGSFKYSKSGAVVSITEHSY